MAKSAKECTPKLVAKIKKVYKISIRNEINDDENVNNKFQVNKMKKLFQITDRCECRNKVVKLRNIRVGIKLDSVNDINILQTMILLNQI